MLRASARLRGVIKNLIDTGLFGKNYKVSKNDFV